MPMPYDLPDRLALGRRSDAAFNVLEGDLIAERASSLGHHGRLVETAMATLRAFDATPGAPEEVWAFLVQRELCGLRDRNQVIKEYGIPGEVLARLGAIEK